MTINRRDFIKGPRSGFISENGSAAGTSVPMRLSADRLTQWHRVLKVAVGLFSVGLGLRVVGAQWA